MTMRLLYLLSWTLMGLALTMCGRATSQIVDVIPTHAQQPRTHTSLISYTPPSPAHDRIISLGGEDMLADLLSVGIRPSAALIEHSTAELQDAQIDHANVQILRTGAGLDLQQIAALQPSLIIGTRSFVTPEIEQQLRGIAPLTLVSSEPARQYAETLDLFGLHEQAQDDLNTLHTSIAHASARWPAGKTVSVAHIRQGAAGALQLGEASAARDLLAELGFELRPAALPEANGLATLDGESLVVFYDGQQQYRPALAWLQQQPGWASLPAVRKGHVYLIDRCAYPGFQGQRQLIERLEQLLGG
ncbi:ABC transporter substrate-binding protein [Chloroflexia bacterium SDU3-3]|nr:ABC transporter substrate-binding protein [Chloroflexia bacterium SDU3-3]